MRIRILLAGLLAFVPFAASAAPEVGSAAPDFSFVGEDGSVYRLADYIETGGKTDARREGGRGGVVIAWFPKAFTSG
jgi:peroxiredoxin